MRRRILASLMSVALAGAMIGGGVLAAFQDAETSPGNAFAAGTLDLKVDGNDDPNVQAYFAVENAKPGDTGSVEINLTNAGTIDGEAYLKVENVTDGEGENPEPETDTDEPGDLSENLILTITWPEGSYSDALRWLQGATVDLGSLGAGEAKTITISYEIPEWVGNEIQGDTVSFDIVFGLNQA